MALSSWWHKSPNFRIDDENEDKNREIYSSEQIDKDFSNTISLLKNSIYNIEIVPSITDKIRKDLLEILLDQENVIPKDLQKLVFTIIYFIFY